tara:strand:- start:1532 stop:1906 length:375 start_codon:yes stop_codon:yes gene_type:complete
MATTTLDNSYVTNKIVVETDLGSSALQNITNGAATVHSIIVDNSLNTNDRSFLKLYDNLVDGGIDVDATEPDYVFVIDNAANRTISFPSGLTIANGLSLRCVQSGATSNIGDPTQNVSVTVIFS